MKWIYYVMNTTGWKLITIEDIATALFSALFILGCLIVIHWRIERAHERKMREENEDDSTHEEKG